MAQICDDIAFRLAQPLVVGRRLMAAVGREVRGGVLTSWTLKKYTDQEGKSVDLVPASLPAEEPRPFTLRLSDPARTTYLIDVRTSEEFAAGGLPGFVHAPGGQLVQATDQWIGVG